MPSHLRLNQIGRSEATWGTETSKYPEEEKSTEIALVAASERATAQTHVCIQATMRCCVGVVGSIIIRMVPDSMSGREELNCMELQAREGEGPVSKSSVSVSIVIPSRAGPVKPGLKLGGPPSKAKYSPVTDSEQVP